MSAGPRIVLLHATPVAVEPVQAAFRALWPEPELVNLLDDSLSPDRAREADLSQRLIDRFVRFGRYAHSVGADAILVTCSAFGPAIDILAAELPVPVLKPNEAMFREAIARGPRIGMIATFAPALITLRQEFDEYAAAAHAHAHLDIVLVEEAMTALRNGDAEAHNRLIAGRAGELAASDVIMLAHFSTSRAEPLVQARVGIPVLSAPMSAVRRLREVLTAS